MESGKAVEAAGNGHERRKDRCETTLGALTRLLEATRRRTELEALLVCDSAGVLVAGAGPARLCDELAAVAPLSEGFPANDTLALDARMQVQRVSIDGVEVLVCGAGPTSAGLSDAAKGCQRILGRRQAAHLSW